MDLLKVLTVKTSSSCSTTLWDTIVPNYPELGRKLAHLRINGRDRETPVADAATLVVSPCLLLVFLKVCWF